MTAGGYRFLEHEGARLSWQVAGAGPAIVLLHGWALDSGSWDLLAARLTQQFTVLRFDRRGFGNSLGVPDNHRNVSDLLAVLAAAGPGRIAVVGMSQGARFALHFARAHPQLVTALVLDGAPELEAESELPLEQYRALLEREGVSALRSSILAHPLMELHGTDPAARTTLAASVGRYRGLDLLHPSERAAAPDLRQIALPTLILNGGLDSAERRGAGRRLQAAIAGAAHVELPGAGHLALLDDPAAYAAAISGFVSRH
jgi:3-oxoadipate enol-lactonase